MLYDFRTFFSPLMVNIEWNKAHLSHLFRLKPFSLV